MTCSTNAPSVLAKNLWLRTARTFPSATLTPALRRIIASALNSKSNLSSSEMLNGSTWMGVTYFPALFIAGPRSTLSPATSALVAGDKVDLGPAINSAGKYVTPIQVDPFSISLEDKLDLLFKADAIMRRNAGVKVAEGNVLAVRSHKFFASTEGAFVEQVIYETGGAISATAVNDTEVQ